MPNRLRNLREAKDMNQTEMSAILGMSQTGYSHYETESVDIPTDILKKLAVFHNTSIDYILCLSNDPTPYHKRK